MDNHGKSWSHQQHLRVLKLYVERGYNIASIAEHMGRQYDSILAQFEKMRLCEQLKRWPETKNSAPYPPDDHRVQQALAILNSGCEGIHHRGPDDPSGWRELPTPTQAAPEPTTEQTMTTEFFATKHYIAGVDVTDMSDTILISAISKEVREIAALEALSPMPKRIAKMIEARKAKLDEAIAFLDAQET